MRQLAREAIATVLGLGAVIALMPLVLLLARLERGIEDDRRCR